MQGKEDPSVAGESTVLPTAASFLEETFGVPVHHLLRSQDQDWGEPGRVDRHIRFLAENMRRTIE